MPGKRDRYIYRIYDESGNLVDKGLAREIADKYYVTQTHVYMAWRDKTNFLGQYRLERTETNPYIPPVTENTIIQFSNSQEDKALDRLGELFYITTNECPLEEYDFNCPNINCKLECQAPKCWKLWALQNTEGDK